MDDVTRKKGHNKDNQAQKALALASNPTIGYKAALASAITAILGADTATGRTTESWKTPSTNVHAAPRIAIDESKSKSALVHKFLSGRGSVAVFGWEDRTLKALVVHYATHPNVANLAGNSEKAAEICALVDELMREPCLQPQFVECRR